MFFSSSSVSVTDSAVCAESEPQVNCQSLQVNLIVMGLDTCIVQDTLHEVGLGLYLDACVLSFNCAFPLIFAK